jgi:hypothetical protein
MRIAGRVIAGIVVFMVVAAVVVLLSADVLLNGFVKERILHGVNDRRGASLSLGTFHYNILANRVSCDNIRLSITGSHHDSTRLTLGTLSCSDINWLRIFFKNGLSCGDLAVEGLQGHMTSLEERTGAPERGSGETERSGEMSGPLLPIIVGRFSANGSDLSRTVHSRSGVAHGSISRFALEIRDFRLEPLPEEQWESALAGARIECEAEGVSFEIPGSPYRIGFARARMLDAGSVVKCDSLRIVPLLSDGQFFSSNRFGSTRYRVLTGRFAVRGLDLPGLIRNEKYTAHLISISRPLVDIVVNKRMQQGPTPDSAKMPNEILSAMRATLHIDSVEVTDGIVNYAELYPYSARPAGLRWTGVRLGAAGISNRQTPADSSAHIEASGMFQDSARMVVSMEMPLAKREFSLSCHGGVDTLRLTSLNSFLEVAERIRITSGVADNIRFAMTARNGGSSGTVHPVYHDLEIEMLAKESGRSGGIVQKVGTMLADIFKIKDDNVSYKSGGGREGPVQYTRKPGDPFFKFLWFSLRSGLGPVVGF